MNLKEFLYQVNEITDKYNILNSDNASKNEIELIDKQINLIVSLKENTLFDIQKMINKNTILPDYMYHYFFDNFSILEEYYNSDFYTMNRLLILDMESKMPNIDSGVSNEEFLIGLYINMLKNILYSRDLDTNDKNTYFSNIETYCIKKHLWEKYLKEIQQLKTNLAEYLAKEYIELIKTDFDYYCIEDFEDWVEEVFLLDSDNKFVLQLKETVEQIKINEQEQDLENCFLPDPNIKIRAISEIAQEILKVGSNIRITAEPYLNAMLSLKTIDDFYGQDTAYNIVSCFLSNSNGNLSKEEKTLRYELMNLIKLYEIKKQNN